MAERDPYNEVRGGDLKRGPSHPIQEIDRGQRLCVAAAAAVAVITGAIFI